MGLVPCSSPDLKQGQQVSWTLPSLVQTVSSPKEKDEEIKAALDFFPAVISEVAFTLF